MKLVRKSIRSASATIGPPARAQCPHLALSRPPLLPLPLGEELKVRAKEWGWERIEVRVLELDHNEIHFVFIFAALRVRPVHEIPGTALR